MQSEKIELDASIIEALRAGDVYLALSEHPGWKLLLDELVKDGDRALAHLRAGQNESEATRLRLLDEWAWQEKWFKELHTKVYGAIETRKKLLREIAETTGQNEQQIIAEWMMEETNGR